MGKLISTETLRNFIKHNICAISNDRKEQLLFVKDGKWADLLDEIPTAYDVDKVVEELKDATFYDESGVHTVVGSGRAIDIVRKGGVEY